MGIDTGGGLLKRRSYAAQWLVFLIAMLAIACFLFWDIYRARNAVDADERDRLQTQVNVIEQNLQRRLITLDQMLQGIAQDLPLLRAQSDATALIKNRLQVTCDAFPGLTTIAVMNAAGAAIASNRDELVGKNFADGERFKAVREAGDPSKIHISPPFKTPLGNFAISGGKLMLDASGGFAGVILAIIEPGYFDTLLRSVLYTPDMRVALIHTAGQIVVRVPDPQGVAGKDLAKASEFFEAHMHGGQTTTIRSGTTYATGESRLVVMRTIRSPELLKGNSLVVTASRETQAMYARWRGEMRLTGTLFAVLLLGGASGLLVFQRRMRTADGIAEQLERERSKAEEDLRQSEENLAITLRSIGDAVIVTDPAGRITQMNPTAERLTGWKLNEARSRPLEEVFQIVNAQSRVAVDNPAQLVMVRGEVVGLANHTVLIARDGKEYQIADSAAPIRNSAGAITGVVLVFSDVTEQYRVQQANRQLAAIVESSNDAIFSRALDGTILSWNAGAERMFGYTASEAIGRHSTFTLAPGQAPTTEENNERLLRGEPASQEMHRMTKDGRVLTVQTSLSPIKDNSGNVVGASVILQDVTARKQAEAARARLAAIIETSNDAIFSRTFAGTMLSWNTGAEKMFGYTAAEVVGKPIGEVLPSFRGPHMEENNEAVSRGALLIREARRVTKDGRTLVVRSSYSPLRDDAGNIFGVSVISQDITELKNAEAAKSALETQLREAQKLQAIGTLAGGIAHDFNNIISAIMGNAELAKDDASDNPAVTESIEEIRKAALRARDLVRQILSFSRRQPIALKCITLEPVISETVRLLHATIPKRVSLAVYCAPDVPPVMADATQIEQILINLTTNASHAISEGPGRVSIILDTVELDAELRKNVPALQDFCVDGSGLAVRVAVTDTGQGMDEATLQRIFEPFFTTKPVNEGTGLGLAVVHGIVESHGGRIVVQSAPGKGTTFSVFLPLATPAPDTLRLVVASSPALSAAGGKLDGMRLLYIDDDAMLVNLVARTLRRSGCTVSAYTDQREALDKLRADPDAFDVLLTDYNMPEISGLDVTREARAIRPSLPVVLTSGYIDDALIAQAKIEGVRELISKVDSAEALCNALQAVVQKW